MSKSKESKIEKPYVETPLMKQYYNIKAVHPDAILLFRVGDFYETFGEDAIRASEILGITLTRRANGAASYVELAGFPFHAVDTYLPKLVRAGARVAICEQLEDPKTTKGLVKRGVVELVTPGVVMGENSLSTKENRYLAAIYFGDKTTGVAFLDISTGEFYCGEGSDIYIDKLISNFAPKEVLYQRGCEERFAKAFGHKLYTYKLDKWLFSQDVNREKLCTQFGTRSLKGFGIDKMDAAIAAAGATLSYLEFTEHKQIAHINSISRIDEDEHVWIDRFTIRNLELFASGGKGEGNERVGFANVIDRTKSAMGGRMLRRWVAMPIRNIDRLNERLDIVSALTLDRDLATSVEDQISLIGDIERIAARIAAQRVTPRELVQLKSSLESLLALKTILEQTDHKTLNKLGESIDPLKSIHDQIATSVYPDPSNNILKGGVIADGVNAELDDLRRVALHGKDLLQRIVERESQRTGIPSLKISFNNVFGYYIEVRNTHKDRVPEEWTRKQTLTSAERYITAELKEYEEKILGAEGRISEIEQHIFLKLVEHIATSLAPLQRNAQIVARLDILQSFARMACECRYVRPQLTTGSRIEIKQGRHPVIEALMPIGERYIPNDITLDEEQQQIVMITGPNMSGKSALLRQTALIILMAQMGSFVPASAAEIGVVDKIFTRVGASDNISQGESTFMVEMLESASILNNISNRSIVLLDEIGRGTSTYDGISIAWAMVEYLHNHPSARAKTLFATHYHELNEMEEQFERVKNYHVSVKEMENNIIFVRKLERGSTEHSFGIHVARMAGMPTSVVKRASEILVSLEQTYRGDGAKKEISSAPTKSNDTGAIQLSMFKLDDPVLIEIRDQIKGLDLDSLTPLEALNKLAQIKKISGL
ncbi:MAG: DNA mismatch repair protein MutS [Rikenellaceae bacterium]